MWRVAIGWLLIGGAVCLGAQVWLEAEEIPTPVWERPLPGTAEFPTSPQQFANEKALVGDKRRYAPAKPFPMYPYAGSRGLSIGELANPPGEFDWNSHLSSSVPGPVLPSQIMDVPAQPPFVSPAFAQDRSAAVGATKSPPEERIKSADEKLTELAARVERYNSAVRELGAMLDADRGGDNEDLRKLSDLLESLAAGRADVLAELDGLPPLQRAQLVKPEGIDPLESLLKSLRAERGGEK